MSTELQLFPEDETLIKCNMPDGKVLEVDALELDIMTTSVFVNNEVTNIPYRTLLKEMVELFNQEYGYRVSLSSMRDLLDTKNKLLSNVKKNISQPSEPLEPTE